MKSLFSVFPFSFKCVVCSKLKSIYQSVGFVEEAGNVRDRRRLCSQACLRVMARELRVNEGVNEYHLY